MLLCKDELLVCYWRKEKRDLLSAGLCRVIVEDTAKFEVGNGIVSNRKAHQVVEPAHLAHQVVVVAIFGALCFLIMFPESPAAGKLELVTHWLFGIFLDFLLVLGCSFFYHYSKLINFDC